jgi:hypothetical protein
MISPIGGEGCHALIALPAPSFSQRFQKRLQRLPHSHSRDGAFRFLVDCPMTDPTAFPHGAPVSVCE